MWSMIINFDSRTRAIINRSWIITAPLSIQAKNQFLDHFYVVISVLRAILHYSWSSNFAVNVLKEDSAKIESANSILLVK